MASNAKLKCRWPPELRAVLSIAHAAMFNLELVAPECTVDITYLHKFSFVLSLPVLIGFLMFAWYALIRLGNPRILRNWSMAQRSLRSARDNELGWSMMGSYLKALDLM